MEVPHNLNRLSFQSKGASFKSKIISSANRLLITLRNIGRNLKLFWSFISEDHRVLYHSTEEGRLRIGSPNSCGIDCIMKPIVIPPRTAVKIPSTLYVDKCSKWLKPTVTPRSGSLLVIQLDPIVGTGDSDYRGEYQMIVRNTSDDPYEIKDSTALYQLVFEWVLPLKHTTCTNNGVVTVYRERGIEGFGSSDKYPLLKTE